MNKFTLALKAAAAVHQTKQAIGKAAGTVKSGARKTGAAATRRR